MPWCGEFQRETCDASALTTADGGAYCTLPLMIGVAVLVGMIAWQVRAIIRGRGPAITLAGLVCTFTFAFSVLRLRPSAAPALRGIPEILARASAVSAVTSLDGRLGAFDRRGVGFLEIFIGDLVRLGGSTQLG